MTMSLDNALDTVMQLPYEEREMLLEILQKRQIESSRRKIAVEAKSSIAAFQAGQLKPQTANEVIQDLRQFLDEDSEE